MKQTQVFEGMQTPALGSDATSVKVKGKGYPIGVVVDEQSSLVLTLDGLEGEDADQPLVEAVGAEVLVTDDTVADELGLTHQVCKSHVKRNTEQLVEELKGLAKREVDGSLAAIGVTAEQAVADLDRQLVQERRPEGELGKILTGEGAAAKRKGQRGVSDSVVVGSVEFVAALDDLSALEGAVWRAARCDE